MDNFNQINGTENNDFLSGTETVDLIKGGGGNDILEGKEGNDLLLGFDGNDRLLGGNGNDFLSGGTVKGSGDDFLDGGLGADSMHGGAGDDTYIVDNPGDKVIEKDRDALGGTSSGGTDAVFSSIDYSINGDKEGTSGFDIENLTLTGTASHAIGNSLANEITGNNFNNFLAGLHGNDNLNGGNGDDMLVGGNGMDTLTGGNGADTFDFNLVSESRGVSGALGRDKITDFSSQEGDKIDLSEIDANLSQPGDQAFLPSQMSYDATTEIFTAHVLGGGADLEIELVGVASAGFDLAQNVIA
jgi:serralysin